MNAAQATLAVGDSLQATKPMSVEQSTECRQQYQRLPLGKFPKKVEISAQEMSLAYQRRLRTGEPVQTWIRRLIRENWKEPHVSH